MVRRDCTAELLIKRHHEHHSCKTPPTFVFCDSTRTTYGSDSRVQRVGAAAQCCGGTNWHILTVHFGTSLSTHIQGMHHDNYRRMIGLVKDSMCTRHTEHRSFLHCSTELCPSDQVWRRRQNLRVGSRSQVFWVCKGGLVLQRSIAIRVTILFLREKKNAQLWHATMRKVITNHAQQVEWHTVIEEMLRKFFTHIKTATKFCSYTWLPVVDNRNTPAWMRRMYIWQRWEKISAEKRNTKCTSRNDKKRSNPIKTYFMQWQKHYGDPEMVIKLCKRSLPLDSSAK